VAAILRLFSSLKVVVGRRTESNTKMWTRKIVKALVAIPAVAHALKMGKNNIFFSLFLQFSVDFQSGGNVSP
jgi:hypothetical protein